MYHSSISDERERKVVDLVHTNANKKVDKDQITAETPFSDLEIYGEDKVGILVDIDEEFDIVLDDPSYIHSDDWVTVGDAFEYAAKHSDKEQTAVTKSD
ncbi:MAG: hypothetical protein ISS36_03810 [Candidatus Aenigmarchaeota archaeon]|nr:hypothetical protein [Candidatus Aenigmarchaeota archaeon]